MALTTTRASIMNGVFDAKKEIEKAIITGDKKAMKDAAERLGAVWKSLATEWGVA